MRKWLNENRRFIAFVLCFGFFRLAIADWNPIPSGSMRPTLLEGDVVLVNRLAYDFKLPFSNAAVVEVGTPKRGDVITFSSPKDGVRLIKRLVAIPGDLVEIRNEILYVNGLASEYINPALVSETLDDGAATSAIQLTERLGDSSHRVQLLPNVPAMRNFGPVTVPRGSYFFLGDNRDNSGDSRYFGFVPRSLLIGRAHRILISADIKGDWLLRPNRIGELIQ
jgi:signal peptidase I